MAESVIPVDLLNPGQVFACIGLAEAAEVLQGNAQAVFDWSVPQRAVFRIRAAGPIEPIASILEFLDRAKARAVAPAGSKALDGWKGGWGDVPELIDRSLGYPQPDDDSLDVLCCEIFDDRYIIRIDHWGDSTGREPVKLWAGAGGYPGATRVRDALLLGKGRYLHQGLSDPFSMATTTTKKSSVRLDWRRDYIPIDLGFSLNEHGANFIATCFPITEILGAVGLGNARPIRVHSNRYDYSVSGQAAINTNTHWMPLPILRSMLGGPGLPWPTRRFRADLGRPNDYDRTFTTVTEENLA